MGSVGVARDTLVVGGVYVPPKVPVAGAADANADANCRSTIAHRKPV